MPSNTDQKRPSAATETVKLDAAALRKLVVSTVVSIDDEDESAEAATAKGVKSDVGADDPPASR